MGLLQRVTSLFSRSGRDEQLLLAALAHAKADRPDEALKIYNQLLSDSGTNATTRARTLYNRALAHSALKDDAKAIDDLEEVLKMPEVPDNVQTAARDRLARVRRRNA
jgi:hypothetical protein